MPMCSGSTAAMSAALSCALVPLLKRYLDDALLVGFAGHDARDRAAAAIFAVFPVEEEEGAIADQASAEGCAVLVADQRRARHAGAIVEPAVGRGVGVAHVLVERAVELVGAALGHQRNLAAGGAALVGALARDGGAELLHGIERHGQDGVEAGVALVIVHVDAIERDVVLVGLGAEHLAVGRDAGLQAEQGDHVARLQRETLDLIFGEGIAHRCVLRVDGKGFGFDADRFGDLAEFHLNIQAGRRIDLQSQFRGSSCGSPAFPPTIL